MLASVGAFLPAMPAPSEFALAYNGTSRRCRARMPNSQRDTRRYDGIPHGTPGAKLARKAAAGRIGSCTLR